MRRKEKLFIGLSLVVCELKSAGTNGRRSAGLPIIQETPGIVEAGDEMMMPPLSHACAHREQGRHI